MTDSWTVNSSRFGPAWSSGSDRQPERRTHGDLPVPCTQFWCEHRFPSKEKMIRHKISDPDHFYCKKCDVDCDSWEGLTAHKVEMMTDFVWGDARLDPDRKVVHITCEFCGEDFRSYGGRKRHRAMEHPANQGITCPAAPECSQVFARAADLIHHLEFNECEFITRKEFKNSVLRKRFNREFLKEIPVEPVAFDEVGEQIDALDLLDGNPMTASEADDGHTSTQEETSSVVSEEKSDNNDEPPCLLPKIESKFTLMRSEAETWPRLPGFPEPSLLKELASLKFENDGNNTSKWNKFGASNQSKHVNSSNDPTPSQAYNADSSCNSTPSQAHKSNSSTSWKAFTAQDGRAPSQATSATTLLDSPTKPAPVGSPSPASQQMVHKPTTKAPEDQVYNLLHVNFWDSTLPTYNTQMLYDARARRFFCPFPRCRARKLYFDAACDAELHIQDIHCGDDFTCRSCHHSFNSTTSLIAHVESTQRCPIKVRFDFNFFLDEVTGGYLEAHHQPEPAIGHVPRPNVHSTALVQNRRDNFVRPFGVAEMRYVSRKPYESRTKFTTEQRDDDF